MATRWFWGGGPFMSNWAPVAHFGLGDRPGPFTLRITWPDRTVQEVPGVTRGARIEVRRES